MLVPVILLMASRGEYLRLAMIAVAIRVMMTTIILMLALTGMVTAVRRRGTGSVVTLLVVIIIIIIMTIVQVTEASARAMAAWKSETTALVRVLPQ